MLFVIACCGWVAYRRGCVGGRRGSWGVVFTVALQWDSDFEAVRTTTSVGAPSRATWRGLLSHRPSMGNPMLWCVPWPFSTSVLQYCHSCAHSAFVHIVTLKYTGGIKGALSLSSTLWMKCSYEWEKEQTAVWEEGYTLIPTCKDSRIILHLKLVSEECG